MGQVLPISRIQAQAEVSDEVLVERCAQGDNRALATLFDRHGALVHRILARTAGVGPQDAPDLTQTTFLQVWTSAKRFKGRSSVRSWIVGIARKIGLMHIRKDVRRRRMLRRARPETQSVDPRGAVDARLMGSPLHAALNALPEGLRSAFMLCEVEGLSGAEAAAALGVRTGTLYRRLHDARKRLRTALEG